MKHTIQILLLAITLATVFQIAGQDIKYERDRHSSMLRWIKDDVKKNYYDPNLKGIDIEAKFKIAAEKIKSAGSIGQMNGIIAEFLIDFDDSHLFYLPPARADKSDYGFDFGMVGDKCFVLYVDRGSNAEKQGLKIGDEIYSLQTFEPTRDSLWKMKYFYFILRPGLPLDVVVIRPDGTNAQMSIAPKVTPGRRVRGEGEDLNTLIRESVAARLRASRHYAYDKLPDAFIWKMPSFDLEPEKVDEIIEKAKGHKSLIIDLRGNGGGRVDMLQRLIATIFDRQVLIGTEKRRKDSKELLAKSKGKALYSGTVIALVDSRSGSASEVFARVLQLEKRGKVFGDRTSGAVMESRVYDREFGVDQAIYFATSITVADLLMSDGKSLEKIGVTPDVVLLPTAADLVARRDVLLAKALESVGVKLTPEAAGRIFPDEDGR